MNVDVLEFLAIMRREMRCCIIESLAIFVFRKALRNPKFGLGLSKEKGMFACMPVPGLLGKPVEAMAGCRYSGPHTKISGKQTSSFEVCQLL